ncbi:MAG: ABC transporter substrate-binding protein, partial [SAR202 cluster bacterium]|nr:ABC transporter substrate-binding protein [SAR202 cluster bacterium]
KDAQGNPFPYVDSFTRRVVPDHSARTAAYRTGKIDQGASLTTPEDVRSMLKTNPYTFIQESFAGFGSGQTAIGFRLDREPWNDARVRRALSLAIDYDLWAQTLYGVPLAGFQVFTPGIWLGVGDRVKSVTEICGCPWYSYDPARAKQLLAEAGYKPGDIKFNVEFHVYSNIHTETHELLAAFWKEIGVISQPKVTDYTVFRSNMERGVWTDITGWSFAWPQPSDPDTTVDNLVPGGGANSNLGWPNDPVLIDLAKQYRSAFGDEAKRAEIYKQIRARAFDQVLSIPWVNGNTFTNWSGRVRNYMNTTWAAGSNEARNWMHAWIDDAYAPQ